jgi:diguanylate cyclase (GGDEF)-like protein
VDVAGSGRRNTRDVALLASYGAASLVLIGAYPFLPGGWRDVDLLVVSVGAAACLAYGRRAVRPDARRPWTLLLWALFVFVVANLVLLVPDGGAVAARWLLAAAGNLLVLVAALTMVLRRGGSDLGGVIDAGVIALAAGSLLWAVLPHRLGPDETVPAQLNLFVVVFALTGVLGALLRLLQTATEPHTALWWLLPAIGLSITGNVVLSLAGGAPALGSAATMLFMAATTATGLFGLDPTGPVLAYPQATSVERLSAGRLTFLGIAVALTPVAIGIRELLAGDSGGLLLAAQGCIVAVLVMVRIGLLSAQRSSAEQALAHQAAHDPLTHLLNRREFITKVRTEIDRNARCSVLFCDLDGFKLINDRFGHDAGDALLIEVAQRLRACVAPPHLISRFGGDEFVILLSDASPGQAQATRECIETALHGPFRPAAAAGVRVSIGMAHAGHGCDPEHLIRSADRAMYREKESRRNDESNITER